MLNTPVSFAQCPHIQTEMLETWQDAIHFELNLEKHAVTLWQAEATIWWPSHTFWFAGGTDVQTCFLLHSTMLKKRKSKRLQSSRAAEDLNKKNDAWKSRAREINYFFACKCWQHDNNWPIRAEDVNCMLSANMPSSFRLMRDRLFVWTERFPLYRNQLPLSAQCGLGWVSDLVKTLHQVRREPTTMVLNEVCSGGKQPASLQHRRLGSLVFIAPLFSFSPTALLLRQNHFQAALQPALPLSSLCVGGRELSGQRNSQNSNLHSCLLSI